MLNMKLRKRSAHPVHLHSPYAEEDARINEK
ncbi:MAG: hypothetical protein JWM42_651, partial [Burkholderia sp.]|nr:hypothetical protein [Burkholderia sp.]